MCFEWLLQKIAEGHQNILFDAGAQPNLEYRKKFSY